MKRLGVIGGMSWHSTLLYYRWINEAVQARLGGHHSADMVMHSVDFQIIEQLQACDHWQQAGEYLAQSAMALAAAGAEAIVLATNTMHRVAEAIDQATALPLLHIADSTGRALQQKGYAKVGLLGTAFTMEQQFYRQRLEERFRLDICVPEAQQRAEVHRIIFQELCHGKVKESSQQHLLEILAMLREQGAEAVIMGCTEITLILNKDITDMPLLDTARTHAHSAVDWMLAG